MSDGFPDIDAISRIELAPDEVLFLTIPEADLSQLENLTRYLNETPLAGRFLFLDPSVEVTVVATDAINTEAANQ